MYHFEVDLTPEEVLALGYAMGHLLQAREEGESIVTREVKLSLANKFHEASLKEHGIDVRQLHERAVEEWHKEEHDDRPNSAPA